jgi:hypothetical protein
MDPHPRRYRLEERRDFRIRNAMTSALGAPITNPMKKPAISALSAEHLIAHLALVAETLEDEPS